MRIQDQPLVIPAETVWKTALGILTTVGLTLWRVLAWLWKRHEAEMKALHVQIGNAATSAKTDLTSVKAELHGQITTVKSEAVSMKTDLQGQIDESNKVQDGILASTVKLADYNQNRQEIRQSIHDLHVKVDTHHGEQMKLLVSIARRGAD